MRHFAANRGNSLPNRIAAIEREDLAFYRKSRRAVGALLRAEEHQRKQVQYCSQNKK